VSQPTHHPEKRVTCKGALRLLRVATEATEKWNTKIVVTSTTHDAFDRLSPSRASHRITRKDDGWVASTADPDRSRQLYLRRRELGAGENRVCTLYAPRRSMELLRVRTLFSCMRCSSHRQYVLSPKRCARPRGDSVTHAFVVSGTSRSGSCL
jgi:hypothetical protein